MGKDPSEIRREIEETRERMGDTVEALSYKADVPARAKDAINERVETVKETIGEAAGRVGRTLGNARETARERGDELSARLDDARDRLSQQMGALGERLPDREDVRRIARRAGIAVENPLGLALGALAIGFLAGLLIPSSEYERRTIGPLRDELIDRAESVGGEVVSQGKAVLQETAQATMSAAQQSAREHGRQVINEAFGTQSREGDTAIAPGMPSDASQGGGLRSGVDLEGGTGAQTAHDPGTTSKQYRTLTDEQ